MKTGYGRLSALGFGCLMLAACSSDGGSDATTTSVPVTSTTVVSSTTSTPPTTASTTVPTTTPATSTTAATTTTVSPDVPGRVSGVTARPGGGSGEVQVDWNAESNTTGYRVTRADNPDGPFAVIADINITTGAVLIAAPEVVNIWSDEHTYVPGGGALSGTDTSSEFHLVDYSGAGERCFKVIAYNAAGRGPASSSVCSGPL